MNQTASQGDNRTGIVASEELAQEMTTGTSEFGPTSSGSRAAAGKVRIDYAREAEGRGLGSVPPPKGIRGKAKAAVDELMGHEPTLFMDKIGERLAFERSGTRLYEALLSKLEADGAFDDGPSREDLVAILEEEHRHFTMLVDVMRDLGGDPTAMTPSADLSATASMGLMKIVTDARTTLLQGLEAILIAEMVDRQGWEGLVELAQIAGKDELVTKFMQAEAIEAEHLAKVRRWVAAGQHWSEPRAAE
jgi:ferritin-like protein